MTEPTHARPPRGRATIRDVAALPPWQALGDEGCARLLEAAAPFGRAVVKSGILGGPPG